LRQPPPRRRGSGQNHRQGGRHGDAARQVRLEGAHPGSQDTTATAFAQELGVGHKPGEPDYPEVAVEEIAAFVRLLGPPPAKLPMSTIAPRPVSELSRRSDAPSATRHR
jgi:hypothetical protein